MKNIAPKRSLGQNFLTNQKISQRIVDSLGINPGDTVIEIGPGTGALTFLLGEMPINLTAIEIDQRAVEKLSEYTPKSNSFEIIHQDFRKFDFLKYASEKAVGGKLKVIGNIPYNLSSEIFFKIFENAECIESAVLMIQKDVALRLIAKPRTKPYGVLTLANDFVCKTKIVFDVAPGNFFPKPKVTSSVIRMDVKDDPIIGPRFKILMELVKAGFNQRRKMLSNALAGYFSNRVDMSMAEFILLLPEDLQAFFTKRAEELTKDDFIRFYDISKQFFK